MVLYILEAPIALFFFGCWCDSPGLWTPHSLCDHISLVHKCMKPGCLSGYLMIVDDRTNIDENTGRTAVIMSLWNLWNTLKNLTFFLDSEHLGNTSATEKVKVDVVVCVLVLNINRRRCRCVITCLVFNSSDNQNYQTQSRRTVCLSGRILSPCFYLRAITASSLSSLSAWGEASVTQVVVWSWRRPRPVK